GIARDDVRFLLVRPGGAAAPRHVRALADTDVVMLAPEDRDLHVLQVAIRLGEKVASARETEPAERSLPSPERMRALFADAEDALAETLDVAAACTLDLCVPRPAMPSMELAPGESAGDRLERTCSERFEEGRRARRWLGDEYERRLRDEIAVLRRLDLAAY